VSLFWVEVLPESLTDRYTSFLWSSGSVSSLLAGQYSVYSTGGIAKKPFCATLVRCSRIRRFAFAMDDSRAPPLG